MAKARPDEDLFAGTSMSFGEHLEELRRCLFKALIGLMIGFIVALIFGDRVVKCITSPLEKSLISYYKDGAILEYEAFLSDQAAAGLPAPYTIEQVKHLVFNKDLVFRQYLVHPSAVRVALAIDKAAPAVKPADKPTAAAGAGSQESEKPPAVEMEPLTPLFVWQPAASDDRATIKSLSAQESFMIYLKASLMAGVIVASPWIFWQLWIFVGAGLYPTERRFVHIFLPISLLLFLSGAAFCFFIIFQFVLEYLFSFNRWLGIAPDPRINEWLGFAIFLPVGFGLSFQLPLVMLFLNRVGLFSVQDYLAKWRVAVLVIFVVSMVLTPSEPTSMLGMAIPLTVLYFAGVLACHWAGPRKNPLEV